MGTLYVHIHVAVLAYLGSTSSVVRTGFEPVNELRLLPPESTSRIERESRPASQIIASTIPPPDYLFYLPANLYIAITNVANAITVIPNVIVPAIVSLIICFI